MKETKKNNYSNILIVCVVCVIILIGLIVYINLNDKTKVYKDIINSSFDVVDKTLVKYKATVTPVDKANVLKATITSPTDKINLNVNYDPQNKIINLGADILIDNETVFNGKIIHENSKTYFKSDILNNTYEINYAFGACDGTICDPNVNSINEIIDSIFTTQSFNYDNLNTISKNLRSAIISSLDKKYITKKNVKTLINGKDTKTTRYSYVLNALSLNKLVNKINNNSKLKDALFATFEGLFNDYGITKTNFKEKVLEQKDNIGTINIYTNNSNKINKVTLSIVDGGTYEVTINDSSVVFEFNNNDDINGKVIYNTTTQSINLLYYYNDADSIEFEVKNNGTNSYTITYNSYDNDNKHTGTVDLNIIESNDNHIKGLIKFKNSDTDLTIDFETNISDNNMYEEVSNTEDLNNITNEEIEKLVNVLTKLEDNKLFKSIKDLFKEN